VPQQGKNYTQFYDKDQPNYILFSFDLKKISYPQQDRAVFYITDGFVKEHLLCRLVDTVNWMIIPSTDFSIAPKHDSSIVLRPGEEKSVELAIKSNTRLSSEALLDTYTHGNNMSTNNGDNDGNDDNISLKFIPDKISVLPSGIGTSLYIKALDDAKPQSYTFPIIANISFPAKITNRARETFANAKSVSLQETSNLTPTILPTYTPQEKLSNFVGTWIKPISGMWTFLAGVATVLTPLIIRIYNRRKKNSR
jgi:hypothetical protein